MTVTIYSIGDINYLELVLNALAALFDPQKAPLGRLFHIGFLVGLILAIFRGMLRGRIGFADFVVSFVVGWLMFVPRVNVVIEDMYSGAVKAVGNVPIGPAFIGGAISQIGYRVTELFETAFSLPDMVPITAGGFTDPLDVLVKTRRALMQHLGKANSPQAGADVRRSFVNYIKDCTLTGVALHQKTMDEIERNPDVMAGIAWEHNGFGTQLFLGGDPIEPTCREATSKLQSFVSGTFLQALREKLGADLNIPPDQVETVIQQALDALTVGAVQAQDFMLTAVIIPFLEEGIPAYHLDQMHFAAAQMVQQAILQRNTQWAAQYSMFERYVRPILTFIEGFTYAIGPFVAFAITLGPIAFRVAGLYLLLNFWIQLWMPILAIINLYIQMAASEQMAALVTAQYQYPSIAGVMQSDWLLQDWLGVGGLLASSAPALAFMLLSGSAVAFTHMVGRLEGGDAINERLVSPDVVKPGPVQQIAPMHAYDPVHGSRMYQAEQVLPSFDMGSLYQSAQGYAYQQAQEATMTFNQSVSRSVSQTVSTVDSAQEAHDLVRAINASSSHVDQYVRDNVIDIMKKTGVGEQHRDAITMAYLGSLGLGWRGGSLARGADEVEVPTQTQQPSGDLQGGDIQTQQPSGGSKYDWAKRAVRKAARLLNLQAGTNLSDQYSLSDTKMDEIARAISERTSDSHRVAQELAERVSQDVREGVTHVASTGWEARDLEQTSRQAQDVLRTSESWNQTRQLGERFGASGSYDALAVSRRIAGDLGLQSDLSLFLFGAGLNQDATELGKHIAQTYAVDSNQAYAAAGLMLMTGYSRPRFHQMDEHERARAMSIGYSLIGRAMSGPEGRDIHLPKTPEGMPDIGEVQRQVDQSGLREGLLDRYSAIRGEAEQKVEEAKGIPVRGREEVMAAHREGQQQLNLEKRTPSPSQLREEYEQRQREFDEGGTPAKWTVEAVQQTAENVQRTVEQDKENWRKELEPYQDWVNKTGEAVQKGLDKAGEAVEAVQEGVKELANKAESAVQKAIQSIRDEE